MTSAKQTIAIGLVSALALAGAACGKSGDSGGGAGGHAAVDKASFQALTHGIKGGDAWATTTAAIDKVMGPATIKRDDMWIWAVDDGEDCWNIKLRKNGDKVADWGGGQINKIAERGYWKCTERSKGNDI